MVHGRKSCQGWSIQPSGSGSDYNKNVARVIPHDDWSKVLKHRYLCRLCESERCLSYHGKLVDAMIRSKRVCNWPKYSVLKTLEYLQVLNHHSRVVVSRRLECFEKRCTKVHSEGSTHDIQAYTRMKIVHYSRWIINGSIWASFKSRSSKKHKSKRLRREAASKYHPYRAYQLSSKVVVSSCT